MDIDRVLRECRELRAFCTRDGWPDNDTLRWWVVEHTPGAAVVSVEFDEVLVEGSGCVAGTVPCYGRLRLVAGADGDVARVEPLGE